MNETIYRLGKYRITECGKNLWWETHIAVGEQLRGNCFIHGGVLIIGHMSCRETGSLIGDFIEQLEKSPEWSKTPYYCFASELLDTGTGQSLTNDLLEQRLSSWDSSSAKRKPSVTIGPGTFRLAQYEITVTSDGEVSWRTYEGMHGIIGGQCTIRSDMLFLGSREHDEQDMNKEEFLRNLHQLPVWDKTIAWSRSEVLRPCREERQREKRGPTPVPRYTRSNSSFVEKPVAAGRNQNRETYQKLLLSGAGWLKKLWYRIHKRKVCSKYLIVMVAAGMLFGLVMTIHSVKKKFHWSHWFKEHHHKHDDHWKQR